MSAQSLQKSNLAKSPCQLGPAGRTGGGGARAPGAQYSVAIIKNQYFEFLRPICSISANFVVIFKLSAKFRSERWGQKFTGQIFEKNPNSGPRNRQIYPAGVYFFKFSKSVFAYFRIQNSIYRARDPSHVVADEKLSRSKEFQLLGPSPARAMMQKLPGNFQKKIPHLSIFLYK